MLCEQAYPTGHDIAHCPHQLLAALSHALVAFRRVEDLAHGQADVGLDGTCKKLRRRQLRVAAAEDSRKGRCPLDKIGKHLHGRSRIAWFTPQKARVVFHQSHERIVCADRTIIIA